MRNPSAAGRAALVGLLCWVTGAHAQGEANPPPSGEAPRYETGRFIAPLDTVDSWVELETAAVNLEIERAWKVGLEWPRRAPDVALLAAGPLEARSIEVKLEREGAEGPAATVVVTCLGLLDDSIGGFRDEIDLAFQLDGSWRVVTHWRSYFCPRGPGRGAWTRGPCH